MRFSGTSYIILNLFPVRKLEGWKVEGGRGRGGGGGSCSVMFEKWYVALCGARIPDLFL